MTATEITSLLAIGVAAVLSAGYAWFLTSWLSRRIRPSVPTARAVIVVPVSALLAAGLTAAGGGTAVFAIIAALVPVLILSSFVDARTMRIPNAYVLQALAGTVGAGVGMIVTGVLAPADAAVAALIGGVVGLSLFAVNVFSGGKLGMGDVKLAAVLAVAIPAIAATVWEPNTVVPMGVLAVLATLLWLTLSFLLGAVGQGLLWLRTRVSASFPFGPYLAVGFVAAIPLLPLLPASFGL